MPATALTTEKTIDNFGIHIISKYIPKDKNITSIVDYLLFIYGTEGLAKEFINYFDLEYPLTLNQLLWICYESNISVNTISENNSLRGSNCTYGEKTIISFKEKDSPPGQIYTVLHELYEVIIQKLSFNRLNNNCLKKKDKKTLEKEAEEFAGHVYAPAEKIVSYINEHNFNVFGLKDYLNCSYATALIKMNDVLCTSTAIDTDRYVPLIGLLYERPYWKNSSSGRTPKLQYKVFTKSKGFPFKLSKKETKDIKFYGDEFGSFTIPELVTIFSKSNRHILLTNIDLFFQSHSLYVDILLMTKKWKAYKYTAKILILIMPTEYNYLSDLAQRLSIRQLNCKGIP